jgi:hypothetical protein
MPVKVKVNSFDLLANWAPPGSTVTVHLEVGLEVKALDVLAVMTSRR